MRNTVCFVTGPASSIDILNPILFIEALQFARRGHPATTTIAKRRSRTRELQLCDTFAICFHILLILQEGEGGARETLESQVKKGSIVDKILEKHRGHLLMDVRHGLPGTPLHQEQLPKARSRKKKFDNNRADNAKTEKLDLWLGSGSQIALTNQSDYANGIKETGKIREFFAPKRQYE
ncbi:unnamed protein product [Symbiodinium natans]|uniref:Uncharacterized protein n=1 Tax=Symbiodinium natans TaxID=878477 RepID=A0A812MA43_9DINO|nr:unnamed protein product [Symbiodinium natans]